MNVQDVTERRVAGRGRDAGEGRRGAPSWKRLLDLACVAAAAPGWLLLGLLVGLWIKLVSRGPILFRQPRVGYLGRPFTCFKFRSMLKDADDRAHQDYLARLISSGEPMTKLDLTGDPRLIPGGRLLRSLGLDELPQILNVLRGEMSLVGPRPCLPYEYEQYLPRHRRRCETLPGLTGLWQVSGKNNTSFEEMIDLDVRYVKNRSLLLDIRILAWTLPAILMQVRQTARQSERTTSRGELSGSGVME